MLTGTPAPRGSDALISVLVVPPTAGEDPYVLEIGRAAWDVPAGTAGSAGLSAPDTQRIRLVQPDTCAVLVSFDAEPGTAHVVRVDDAGEATAAPRTDEDEPAGPLDQTDPSGCP